MAFNNFPYTDLNDLNIDWLLRAMKEAVTTANNAMEIAQNLKTFVETYFDNLDVQEEINNKIDDMVASGEFKNILNEIAPDIIAAWISSHLTPTTPPVDNTLSIREAAADSKKVGDICLHYNLVTSTSATETYENLLSNLPQNTYSWVSNAWFSDTPFSSSSYWIITIGASKTTPSSFSAQIALKTSEMAVRVKTSTSWGSWGSYDGEPRNFLKYAAVSETEAHETYGQLLSNLPVNTFSWISGSWFTDSPVDTTMWLEYWGEKNATAFGMQRIFVPTLNKRYYRRLRNGVWDGWTDETPTNMITYNGLLDVDVNLNEDESARTPGFWYGASGGSKIGLPNNKVGPFMLFVEKQNSIVWQTLTSLSRGRTWTRYLTTGGEWITWRSDYRDCDTNYVAFGDSLVKGQVGGDSNTNSDMAYPFAIGRAIDMNVYNRGVRAQGLISYWDTIIDALDNNTWNQFKYNTDADIQAELASASLVTVGWAYNDTTAYTTIPFGTVNDRTPTSFIGYYYSIMEKLQTMAPNAMVILITGYGAPAGGTLASQFTKSYEFTDGNKTVGEMYDALETMCNNNGWCCINQHKGTVFNKFKTNLLGDNIHPNQNGYTAYGNFIAAKVAGLWYNMRTLA